MVNLLTEEVAERFSAIDFGELRYDDERWPYLWTHTSTDRRRFLGELSAFYGNAAASFGKLLTPVVNGMRVSGPFVPTWADRPLKLVLVDSEGLGHTPSSIASLSTSLVRQVASSDSVLVVDNAQQPMQAGPLAALAQIVESGSVAKLHLLFTHLDAVKGPNLAGYQARIAHVRESVENALRNIEVNSGGPASRALKKQVDSFTYYAGRLDRVLTGDDTLSRKGAEELARLGADLEGEAEVVDHGDAEIVVARKGVVLAVEQASTRFQDHWLVRLGAVRPEPGSMVRPEHWSRVKALCRRIVSGTQQEYQDLQPVADFRQELQRVLYQMLQYPVRWQGQEATDEEKSELVDSIALALSQQVVELAERSIITDRSFAWKKAWEEKGQGSTARRATILAEEVIKRGAPIPTADLSTEAAGLIVSVERILDKVQQDHQLVIE